MPIINEGDQIPEESIWSLPIIIVEKDLLNIYIVCFYFDELLVR